MDATQKDQDQTKAAENQMMNAEQFEEHMWKFNSYGFTMVSICFGNQLGLFDLLMKANRPMTSVEIAKKADMKERYVREWLGSMVAAQIVLLDGDEYYIPKERHNTIRVAATLSQGASVWFKRFEQTKECFRKEGQWGNNFDADDEFWSYFSSLRNVTGDAFLDNDIIPILDEQPHPAIKAKLESGIKVLDVACGSGQLTMAFAKRFPKSTFVGLDFSEKALALAEETPDRRSLINLTFKQGDVYQLEKDASETYDLIMIFDSLHDFPDPKKALVGMSETLKPDGKIIIMDFIPHSKQSDNVGDLTASMFYTCSMFSCLQNSMMAEPRIGYGACWGKERMIETISEVLNLDKMVELPLSQCLFICSKKK